MLRELTMDELEFVSGGESDNQMQAAGYVSGPDGNIIGWNSGGCGYDNQFSTDLAAAASTLVRQIGGGSSYVVCLYSGGETRVFTGSKCPDGTIGLWS